MVLMVSIEEIERSALGRRSTCTKRVCVSHKTDGAGDKYLPKGAKAEGALAIIRA